MFSPLIIIESPSITFTLFEKSEIIFSVLNECLEKNKTNKQYNYSTLGKIEEKNLDVKENN